MGQLTGVKVAGREDGTRRVRRRVRINDLVRGGAGNRT